MSYADLIDRADELLSTPAAELDLDDVVTFAKSIESQGTGLSQDEASALLGRVDQLVGVLRDDRDATRARLQEVGDRRRAMKGYGHLRRTTRAQRVYRKA